MKLFFTKFAGMPQTAFLPKLKQLFHLKNLIGKSENSYSVFFQLLCTWLQFQREKLCYVDILNATVKRSHCKFFGLNTLIHSQLRTYRPRKT